MSSLLLRAWNHETWCAYLYYSCGKDYPTHYNKNSGTVDRIYDLPQDFQLEVFCSCGGLRKIKVFAGGWRGEARSSWMRSLNIIICYPFAPSLRRPIISSYPATNTPVNIALREPEWNKRIRATHSRIIANTLGFCSVLPAARLPILLDYAGGGRVMALLKFLYITPSQEMHVA